MPNVDIAIPAIGIIYLLGRRVHKAELTLFMA